ncbi:hypothetical protein BD289DRAFT_141479 [Coniella lustricola]|uniref:Uncharacterized protein n=1 Tax=Coniella lustricola TaxID=2025994 RepID=A0A2T3AF98_9PEZI|nr:hypothetical protein BD289DRAFT_141479 [Coniella lustricola]
MGWTQTRPSNAHHYVLSSSSTVVSSMVAMNLQPLLDIHVPQGRRSHSKVYLLRSLLGAHLVLGMEASSLPLSQATIRTRICSLWHSSRADTKQDIAKSTLIQRHAVLSSEQKGNMIRIRVKESKADASFEMSTRLPHWLCTYQATHPNAMRCQRLPITAPEDLSDYKQA